MTKDIDLKNENEDMMKKRMHRRSLLKAGAIVAPIALTLHGGVPLAHAESSGQCGVKLIKLANGNGTQRQADLLGIPVQGTGFDRRIAEVKSGFSEHCEVARVEDYKRDTVIESFDGSDLHWEFITNPANNILCFMLG
jgi:hypothetical protein